MKDSNVGITHAELELTYAIAIKGTEEPELAIGIGSAIKHIYIKMEMQPPTDIDGNLLQDNLWYMVSKEGIVCIASA
jgi:hypothetical protein